MLEVREAVWGCRRSRGRGWHTPRAGVSLVYVSLIILRKRLHTKINRLNLHLPLFVMGYTSNRFGFGIFFIKYYNEFIFKRCSRRLQHKLLKVRIKSRIEIVLEFRPLTTRTSIESDLMYLFRADTIKSGFIFITLRLSCKVLSETWPRRPSMNHSHLSPSTRTSLTPGPSPWLIAVLWHAWPIGSPGSDHTRLDFDPRAGGAAALLWLQRARIVL